MHKVIGDCFSVLTDVHHSLSIATQAYESNNFISLPILADALEEAGCNEPELLIHLREERTHYRGCWALDLLLGKS